MSSPQKVVFLHYPQSGTTTATWATLPTQLPDPSVRPKLIFSSPVRLTIPPEFTPYEGAFRPIFDARKNQIIWPTYQHSLEDTEAKLHSSSGFIRLAKYLTVVDPEHVLSTNEKDKDEQYRCRSAIIESNTGLIALGGVSATPQSNQKFTLAVHQKRQKDKAKEEWISTEIPFANNKSYENHTFQTTVLFNSGHPSSKTVYHTFVPHGENLVILDTLDSSAFSQLYNTAHPVWRRTKLIPKFNLTRFVELRPLVMFDKPNNRFRLFIFYLDPGNYLTVESFPMRADGSPDTYSDSLASTHAAIVHMVPAQSKGLNILLWGERILAVWTDPKGTQAVYLVLQKDGSPAVENEFKVEYADTAKVGASPYGVVVPEDFF